MLKHIKSTYHWCKHNRRAVIGHITIMVAFLFGYAGYYGAEHVVGFIGTGAVLHHILTEV